MTPAGRAGAFLAQVSSSTIMVCGDHNTVFFVALRGQKEVAVAVLQLPFFVPLSDPSWTKKSCRCRSAVAVLRAPSRPFVDKKKLPLPFCSCCSSCPFAALRGQKEVAVAVLQLPFFVPLRDPSWTKRSCRCRCRSAVAVLRAPSWIKKVFPTTLRGQTTIEHTNRICLSSYIRTENRLPKTIQS